MAFVCHRQQ